jgi:hypothetical protein
MLDSSSSTVEGERTVEKEKEKEKEEKGFLKSSKSSIKALKIIFNKEMIAFENAQAEINIIQSLSLSLNDDVVTISSDYNKAFVDPLFSKTLYSVSYMMNEVRMRVNYELANVRKQLFISLFRLHSIGKIHGEC